MQEFKIGDKVLVEMKITDVTPTFCKMEYMGAAIYILKECLKKARGKTYEDGMAEAWETARRIMMFEKDGGLSLQEVVEIFGVGNFADVFKNFTAAEAAAKIKAWEDAREIHVGDIVTDSYGNKDVVTEIGGQKETDMVCILRADGYAGTVYKQELTKTGHTIDIAGLLAEIGGAE